MVLIDEIEDVLLLLGIKSAPLNVIEESLVRNHKDANEIVSLCPHGKVNIHRPGHESLEVRRELGTLID
jgi:hypothetical protein